MTSSLYSTSIPVFQQMLGGLGGVLAKAQAHAADRKIDPAALLQARLYPDMFPLLRQVQVACDFAKSVSARLAGVPVPAFEDTEQSFEDLQGRITKTLDFVTSLRPQQFEGSATREIVTQAGTPKEKRFEGQSYLLSYGLPHFFFHVTTAYGIRHPAPQRHRGRQEGLPGQQMSLRAARAGSGAMADPHGRRSTVVGPPRPLRCSQSKTESTVTVSMRSAKRLSLGWSSKATLAAPIRPPRRVKAPIFSAAGW